MTAVAITGASGLLGRRVVDELINREGITRVVGLDRRAPRGVSSPRFLHRPADVTDPAIVDALQGIDVVVHLATRLQPRPDEATMRALNVDGTRNLVAAASEAGVARFVHLSSVAAYGAAADNDLPLTESSPVRGTAGFPLAEQQAEIERWLQARVSEGVGPELAVLRAAMVIGPGVDNLATRQLEAPRFPAVRGHEPPLQVVHIDDLAAAIVHVVVRGLTGTYNVSAEGWLAFDEVRSMLGRGLVALPEELAFSVTERLYSLGVKEYPPGLVTHLMYPWVMSPAKLIATGWRPEVTNRAALAEAVVHRTGYVALGGVRTRWATVGKIAAGMTAIAVVLATWWLGRRRR